MVTKESKKFPPLSDAFKEVQREFKLLDREGKEIQKQWVQRRRDVRDGAITKEQSDELDEKSHARTNEIALAMFSLTMKMFDLK